MYIYQWSSKLNSCISHIMNEHSFWLASNHFLYFPGSIVGAHAIVMDPSVGAPRQGYLPSVAVFDNVVLYTTFHALCQVYILSHKACVIPAGIPKQTISRRSFKHFAHTCQSYTYVRYRKIVQRILCSNKI